MGRTGVPSGFSQWFGVFMALEQVVVCCTGRQINSRGLNTILVVFLGSSLV